MAQALAGRRSLRCGVGQFVRTGGLHMVNQHTGARRRHRSAPRLGDGEDNEFAIKLPRRGGIGLARLGLGQQARFQQGFGDRCARRGW